MNEDKNVQAVPVKQEQQIIEMMTSLCNRWQDEKEYEDWADYIKAARGFVQQLGGQLVKFTKRPFVITYSMGGKIYIAKVTSQFIQLAVIE